MQLIQAIGALQEENNNLKSGLTELLQLQISTTALDQVEALQTRLLAKDDDLALMQHEASLYILNDNNPESVGYLIRLRLSKDIQLMKLGIASLQRKLGELWQEIGKQRSSDVN